MKRVLILVAVALAGCNQPLFETGDGSGASGAGATGASGSLAGAGATSETSSGGAGAGGSSATTGSGAGSSNGHDIASIATGTIATTGSIGGPVGATGGTGSWEVAIYGQRVQPEIVFIVDRSGSMNDPISPPSADTKWSVIQQAVPGELTSLAEGANGNPSLPLAALVTYSGAVSANTTQDLCVPGGVSLTMTALTEASDGSRDVPAADLAAQALGSLTPFGGTPTTAALDSASGLFSGLVDRLQVLITDGAANCDASWAGAPSDCLDGTAGCTVPGACYDANGNAESSSTPLGCADTSSAAHDLSLAAATGIQTLVIGVGDVSADAAALDALGQAGGLLQPSDGGLHFEAATDVYALEAALNQVDIVLQNQCTIELAQRIPDGYTSVQVSGDGVLAADVQPSADGMSMKIRSPACGTMGIGVPQVISFFE